LFGFLPSASFWLFFVFCAFLGVLSGWGDGQEGQPYYGKEWYF
jgi:hypothetical protein